MSPKGSWEETLDTVTPSLYRGLALTGGSARPVTSHLAIARLPRAAVPHLSPAQTSLMRTLFLVSSSQGFMHAKQALALAGGRQKERTCPCLQPLCRMVRTRMYLPEMRMQGQVSS